MCKKKKKHQGKIKQGGTQALFSFILNKITDNSVTLLAMTLSRLKTFKTFYLLLSH